MPDLLTHTILSRALTSFKWRKFALLFAFGSILPDILRSIPTFFFPNSYLLSWFTAPFHTPFVLICLSLLISLLPRKILSVIFIKNQWQTFIMLLMSTNLHLFLDLFQKHIQPSYMLFFPFSFQGYEIGWFWPEDSLKIIWILVIILVIILFLEKKLKNKKLSF